MRAVCRYYLSRTVPDTPTTRRGSSPWLPTVILHVMSEHYSKLYIHDFHKSGPTKMVGGSRHDAACAVRWQPDVEVSLCVHCRSNTPTQV